MNIYQIIKENLDKGRKGVLATVISRSGSAPRDVGAKMYVNDSGRSWGTIGGGLLEHYVQEVAVERRNEDRATVLHMKMDSKTVTAQGMLCGGNVDILVEPVEEQYRRVYERLAEMERRGCEGVVVTALGTEVFTKTIVGGGLDIEGDPLSDAIMTNILTHRSEKGPMIVAEGAYIVEPVLNRAKLYIFGAGHISRYIAKVAAMVEFFVVVIDDRREYACLEHFPEVDEIVVKDFVDAFSSLSFTGKEFVVIVTRGHSHDADVLRECLSRDMRYLGMIGSKRKIKMIFDLMHESGFAENVLSKVYAPIGLSIHAETPEEIAVSIVSQLIQVRGE